MEDNVHCKYDFLLVDSTLWLCTPTVFGTHLTGSGVPMVAVLATGETAGGVDTRVPN
jgi:hypothetical protein